MNLLDENFPDDQRDLLRRLGVPVRQIGCEVGNFGMCDDEIIPLLHRLGGVIFIKLVVLFSSRRPRRSADPALHVAAEATMRAVSFHRLVPLPCVGGYRFATAGKPAAIATAG